MTTKPTPKPPVRRHGFGRLVSYDLRDTAHLMRPHLRALTPGVTHKTWSTKPPVDQGQTPACTGYSALTMLLAGPVINKTGVPTGDELYRLAQRNDEWDGEDYEGSSVRGAMKGLQSLGYLTEYVWAGATQDITDWLLHKGPVVFGTVWLDSMMEPDWTGISRRAVPYLRVDRTHVNDADAQGHAYTAVGVSTTAKNPDGTTGFVTIQNSWGAEWGAKGKAHITLADVAVLMSAGGECAAPTEIRKVVIGKAAA